MIYNGVALTYLEPVERTPEEIQRATAETEAAAEEVARERRNRADARTVAIARGEELLLSLLDENQRESTGRITCSR